MNPAPKPRLTCRVVRLWSEISGDSDAALERSAHVKNCPDCQAYYQASEQLVRTLRQTATARTTAPVFSDDLAQRIALSVRESTPVGRPRQQARNFGFAAAIGAAAALVLAVAMIRKDDGPSQGATTVAANPANTSRPASVDVADLVANVDTMGQKFLDAVQPSASRLATENPLARELDHVRADARSAIGYLALNFFPNGEVPFARTGADNT